MNCHTMKTKIIIFFALVSCFRAFAEDYANCYYLKNQIYSIASTTDTLLFGTAEQASLIISENRQLGNSGIIFNAADSILEDTLDIQRDLARISAYADSIPCDTNDTCSVDLEPLYNVVSNIYEFVSLEYAVLTNCEQHLSYIRSCVNDIDSALSPNNANSIVGSASFSPDFWVNVKYPQLLSAVSNFNNDVSFSLGIVTNRINYLQQTVLNFYNSFQTFQGTFTYCYTSILSELTKLTKAVNDNFTEVISYLHYLEYLQYLEGISQDISYLATNEYFNVNVLNLTNYFVVKSANVAAQMPGSFHRLSFEGNILDQASTNPYNSPASLRRSNIAETIQGGFANLLTSTVSLNNYFYWLMNYLATNKTDLTEITTGFANLTNILNRVDDYVLGDFSNQFYHVFECIDTLVSNSLDKVDYTTNLVEITQQLYTNNNHLVSIDSKLDVLGYIKVLSDTPLSQFSGDSYYDYLTNLYLTGGSSSSVSTNWFERIEILLASLVFGDSVSSNISTDVEFSNFSEDKVRDAFNDYTFQNELNSGIDLVENTGENFLTILRGFHNALASVSQPQSIAIGIGGIDGADTLSFEDAQHGHFQVSFGSGASDNFTLIVRSMTTIIWILFTMMFIYFSARWLLFKVLFFYRLMRTLITSLFLK